MKEFITAFDEAEEQAEREARIKALMEKGKTREEAEAEAEEDPYVEFSIDGRTLRAYQPNEGQLVFMLSALGRGQTNDQRLGSMVNIMMASLRDDDADYFESRLISKDKKRKMPIKQVEAIFEYLVGEWFADPTQSPSDSSS